jgi:hypothetical protein
MDQGKIPSVTGARKGKRMLAAEEVMKRMGQNPIENIARNALKAEINGDYGTAVRGWSEIQCYLAPKRKPIDPEEQAERSKRLVTLDELQAIKHALRSNLLEAEAKAIDAQEVPILEDISDLI